MKDKILKKILVNATDKISTFSSRHDYDNREGRDVSYTAVSMHLHDGIMFDWVIDHCGHCVDGLDLDRATEEIAEKLQELYEDYDVSKDIVKEHLEQELCI